MHHFMDSLKTATRWNCHVSLTLDAREDIKWWATFVPVWSGRYKILHPHPKLALDLNLQMPLAYISKGNGFPHHGLHLSKVSPANE